MYKRNCPEFNTKLVKFKIKPLVTFNDTKSVLSNINIRVLQRTILGCGYSLSL